MLLMSRTSKALSLAAFEIDGKAGKRECLLVGIGTQRVFQSIIVGVWAANASDVDPCAFACILGSSVLRAFVILVHLCIPPEVFKFNDTKTGTASFEGMAIPVASIIKPL
jgi:hypothetical protein